LTKNGIVIGKLIFLYLEDLERPFCGSFFYA